MQRRNFFKSLVASIVGLFAIGKKTVKAQEKPELYEEGCSYCGKQEYIKNEVDQDFSTSKTTYFTLSIETPEKEKRNVCIDCLIKVFDKVLL